MKKDNKTKGGSALKAAAQGRSAVAQVDAHSNSGLANTGTNISYEGATAPGSGGSAGTGYASGKEATGETTRTVAEQNRGGSAGKKSAAKKDEDTEEDDDYDEDTELDDEDDFDEEDMDDEEEVK